MFIGYLVMVYVKYARDNIIIIVANSGKMRKKCKISHRLAKAHALKQGILV